MAKKRAVGGLEALAATLGAVGSLGGPMGYAGGQMIIPAMLASAKQQRATPRTGGFRGGVKRISPRPVAQQGAKRGDPVYQQMAAWDRKYGKTYNRDGTPKR